jgi:hypothetical protein
MDHGLSTGVLWLDVVLLLLWTGGIAAVSLWWGQRHPKQAAVVAADVTRIAGKIGS